MIKVISATQVGEDQHGIVLELSDGYEIVECSKTKESYAVPKSCRIPLSLKGGIGSIIKDARLPGFIVKVEMEPYQFKDPISRRIRVMKHGYAYKAKIADDPIGATRIGEA
jgi:hypothetical protein